MASGECLEWVPSLCGAPQRPDDGKRGDKSKIQISHWLTREDEGGERRGGREVGEGRGCMGMAHSPLRRPAALAYHQRYGGN